MNSTLCGLSTSVVRPSGTEDMTRGGISGLADRITIVGICRQDSSEIRPLPKGARVTPPHESCPAAVLVVSTFAPSVHIVPVVEINGELVPAKNMAAGGNYATLNDSRLGSIVDGLLGHHFYGAVAIHDLDLFA